MGASLKIKKVVLDKKIASRKSRCSAKTLLKTEATDGILPH